MKVFVTGASGFVGTGVVRKLMANGHEVLGLARSEASAGKLRAAGASVHNGTLEDLDSLKAGAAAADAVIHLAFIHNFADMPGGARADRAAISAMADVLEGSGKPLIITSGIGILPTNKIIEESDSVSTAPDAMPRGASETLAIELAAKGIRTAIVRLPPSVHDISDKHGFIPTLINIAREKGVSAYSGDGSNRWCAVALEDATEVYLKALEHGKAGARYHAVGETGIPMKQIAEAIGKKLGVPVAPITAAEAPVHFGWMAHFAARDIAAASQKTSEELGVVFSGMGLLSDISGYSL